MLTLAYDQETYNSQLHFHQKISNQLYENGWSVIDDYLPYRTISELLTVSQQLMSDKKFKDAGINYRVIDKNQRTDQTYWINPDTCYHNQSKVIQQLERLRIYLNRENQLGLFDLELHASIYPTGGYYKKHFDNFQKSSSRILTIVLYLNQQWEPQDGGQLRIYLKNNMSINIDPIGGRLVTFFSNIFEHEVLPTNSERYSFTGWFRRSELPI
jgi:SM-20-related protein